MAQKELAVYAGVSGRGVDGYSGGAASLYDFGRQREAMPDGQRNVFGTSGAKGKENQEKKENDKWHLIIKKNTENFIFRVRNRSLWRSRR